ncbi:MAG: hypothetical protein F6K36_04415 [Symploca sp. SIO3C6]|nr:hypothetical protein [Symploca sp. SIO3C6]
MFSIFINALAASFLLAAAGLLIYLFLVIREQRTGKFKRMPSRYRYQKRKSFFKRKSPVSSHRLGRRLICLLNGDVCTAERLFDHAYWRYPGQSDSWVLEKVIYDLERDRRSV